MPRAAITAPRGPRGPARRPSGTPTIGVTQRTLVATGLRFRCRVIIAPFSGDAFHGFTTRVEGFDEQPMFPLPWQPPHYAALFEAAGYEPAHPLAAAAERDGHAPADPDRIAGSSTSARRSRPPGFATTRSADSGAPSRPGRRNNVASCRPAEW